MTTSASRKRKKSFWIVKPGDPQRRLMILLIGFAVVALALALRCVYVQGLDLTGKAGQALSLQPQPLPADRGTITDRNGEILAQSEPAINITADPTIVATNGLAEPLSRASQLRAQAGPGIIAGILEAHLGGDFQTYYDALTATTRPDGTANHYSMLAQTVVSYTEQKIIDRVNALGYVGLYEKQAPIRDYPGGTVGSNVVGYMTYNDDLAKQDKYPWVGGGGLEQSLNSSLAGVDGQKLYQWSPYGDIPSGASVVEEPKEGTSYQLTLDLPLQYMQDQRLAQAVQQSGAANGKAITMSVKTGQILAMSNYPTFDPNDLAGQSNDNLGNRAVTDAYEPGSVEKLLTVSALVDQGLADAGTRVVVPGGIASGDSIIGDAWSHGTLQLTTAGIIGRSSNIGAVELSRKMSKESLVSYLHSFGLGSTTGIGLPGEESGYVPDETMSNQTRDNMAFGQGLSVTAIQEAAAVNAIANGGVYISPTIIQSATGADGQAVAVPQATSHRVISQETSTQMLQMMESVVALNPGAFDIEGYRTAAKSGTAEAADPVSGGYNGHNWVMSYLGVAPAEDPAILTYVVLDHPQVTGTGTSLAAPVVRDVMSVALPRYGVLPSTTSPSNLPTEW